MPEVQSKYATLCSHDFQKSLTNEIDLYCNIEEGLLHKISQYGKICSKCTQIIKDSYTGKGECIVCSDTIEEYLKQRELCQHQIREFDQVQIKCLNESNRNHDVIFKTDICKKCCDKVRAAFMYSKVCKVCEGKQNQVIKNLQKVFISPSYSHIQNVLSILRAANATDQIYQNQIESACKAEPLIKRVQNNLIPSNLLEAYNSEDPEDAHMSKRYKLYPKCRKHRSNFINVCNSCLVALLNLDCCPYGCIQEGKAQQKVKKQTNVKYYETGFLNVFPQIYKNSYHLELFIVKLIEQKARLDRWQASIKKITPKSSFQQKFLERFPLFSSVAMVSNKNFIITGGVLGSSIDQMRPTNIAFVIVISNDNKEFEIIELSPMNYPRSGHSLVYNQNRKMVFAVGGFLKEGGYMKETQVYSIDNKQWYTLGDLKIQRSKPTLCIHQDTIYVFGGITSNEKIFQFPAEKFNYDTRQWEEITYQGYDYPFITNSTPSTSILSLQNNKNLLFFGGSNITNRTNVVQKIILKQNSFSIDYKNYLVLQYPRENCVLGLINDQTLICFGGSLEHESFLTVDAAKVKVDDNQLQIFYINDRINLGSYRSITREDSDALYTRMKNQLKGMGLISEQQIELIKEDGLVGPYNCQVLEKLWFTIGKNYVWLPL